jgi:outer membrane protein assembly factor BamB
VHPKRGFWTWIGPVTSPRRWLLAGAFLAALGIAALLLLSVRGGRDTNDTRAGAPPPSETLMGPEESGSPSPRVKVITPPDVAELPPIVEASRNVMFPGSSSQVAGPMKPRVLWHANITVGDAWRVVGIAADGTVYLYDLERNAVDAIRDGKEQWAYRPQIAADFGSIGFDPDGRIWLGDYCFNSRGEGGRVKKNLVRDPATLLMDFARQQNTYRCSDGKVTAMDAQFKRTWSVDLDGNCGSQSPSVAPKTGDIYASSDAGTLYAMTRDGRPLWTVKQACRNSDVEVYPLLNDELMVACSHQPLYSLREGKPLWTMPAGAAADWSWSTPLFDGSGNIYVGAAGPSAMTELIALDKSGNQIWEVPAGTVSKPIPVGFDTQGRLYVSVAERIVSLSR